MDNPFGNVAKDQLVGDLKTVIADAEAQMKQTVNHAGEELSGIRSKAEKFTSKMKVRLADEQAAVVAFSKDAAKNADIYVHLYPWTSIGIAAGVGLVVGLLSSRR